MNASYHFLICCSNLNTLQLFLHNDLWCGRSFYPVSFIFFTTLLLNYSMKQSPWKANRFSASQEIPCILSNLNVHYHIYKCPLPVPIPSQINPVHAPHSTSWRSVLIFPSPLRLGLPIGLFPSGFPTKILCISPLSHVRATCPAHLILLNLITCPIFGEGYISLRSSLCSFLHSADTSSLLGPNILLSTPILNHPQPRFLPQCERPSFTPMQDNKQHPKKPKCYTGYIIPSHIQELATSCEFPKLRKVKVRWLLQPTACFLAFDKRCK